MANTKKSTTKTNKKVGRPKTVNNTVVKKEVTANSIVDELANDDVNAESNLEVQTNTKDLISEISGAINEISGNENADVIPKVKKVNFEPGDMIPTKSVFLGKLGYINPVNKARYTWKQFGSVVDLPFSEIQTMNNHKEDYLYKPYILVLNPDVAEYYNLIETYEKVVNINKLEKLFKTGKAETIRPKIKEAVQVGMREVVIAKVRKMREDNSLVDINIIKMLQEELKYAIE